MSNIIELWVDGSRFRGKTSWAYRIVRNGVLLKKDAQVFYCKHVIEAEIMAIIQGLKNIPESINRNLIIIKTDNMVIVEHMSKGLCFCNSTKIRKSIIAELVFLSKKFNVRWSHVYSHAGIVDNNRVDSAARKAILDFRAYSRT
jgi:ribonuclease HI